MHIPGTVASDDRSIPAQIAYAVYDGGVGFYVVQFSTAAILILAANTAYRTSRGCRRSWRATATCRGSS